MAMTVQNFRAACAKRLVKMASGSISASYNAWVRVDKGEVPNWYQEPWHKWSRLVNRITIPLARRFDRDSTTTQMIEESWWG